MSYGDPSEGFSDLLVITRVSNCSDDAEQTVVYTSETDGNPQDFLEQPLAAGTIGNVMHPTVGPFPAGTYRLTVTLDVGRSNTTTYNCKEIDEAFGGSNDTTASNTSDNA